MMNRIALQHEATAPLVTRYTVWRKEKRDGLLLIARHMNCCTLAAAIGQAQRMVPQGYITTHGERP